MELEAFLTKITRGLVKHHVRHGLSKKEAKTLGIKCIRSLGTERNYQAAIYKFLQWRNSCGLSVKRNYLRLEMTEFLHEQSELLQQTQLDIVRRAMELVFAVELQGVVSTRLTLLNARSYFSHEIAAICDRQTYRNAISTALCAVAGLRGMELLTIRRADEMSRSTHRVWKQDLFAGLENYVIYIVAGKGGLMREVAIPTKLATSLEARRLPFPKVVRDRGIDHKQYYDIGGGQSFAQSFSEASIKALGFSHGAHGLRHSYAQVRLRSLRHIGVPILDALAIVSQELGHFRPEITLVYLR